MEDSGIKSRIANVLLRKLHCEEISSVTIVGSFCDKDDLSVISDIDTIVICKDLDEAIFHECLTRCQELTGDDLGLPGKQVIVNPTFGPLKFDSAGNIVIHLMVYDHKSHREHVNQSPFTCYDWERSNTYAGKSLKEIYPVLKLQRSNFKAARRGIRNYISDLKSGVISYREYEFKNNRPTEVTKTQRLNSRLKAEYSYHIIKNLVCNYCKMRLNKNTLLTGDALRACWLEFLPSTAKFLPFFNELEEFKNKRSNDIPESPLEKVLCFIKAFEEEIDSHELQQRKIDLVRHQATDLNDGSFLGQRRDPDIISDLLPASVQRYNAIYSSPLKRAMQTAQQLFPDTEIRQETALTEIDYGEAEGLDIGELTRRFPSVIQEWTAGQDPAFPNGENSRDVLARVKNFLCQLEHENTALITHNVVIRCLLGDALGIDIKNWHLIEVPHTQVFSMSLSQECLYPNLSADQLRNIRDRIAAT